MKNREKKGFTLIELIMVIVILGILAAVAIPKFVDLSSQAEDATCDGIVGSLNSASAIYYANEVANGRPAAFPVDLAAVQAEVNGDSACPAAGTLTYTSSTGITDCGTH